MSYLLKKEDKYMSMAKTIFNSLPEKNRWSKLKELIWKYKGQQTDFSEEGTFGKKIEVFKFPDKSNLKVVWFDVDRLEPYDSDINVEVI